MKYKTVVSAIMAILMTMGNFSFAKGDDDRRDRGHNDRGHHEQAQRGGQQDHRDNRARPPPRNWEYTGHAYRFDGHDQRGAGPGYQFHRGERLPPEYHHRHYVVDDWRGHHLSAPPYGYHWVQAGSDYVLVAIATGIIVQLLLNN